MIQSWKFWLAYISLTLVVVVAALEVALRFIYGDPDYYFKSRFLYEAPGVWRNFPDDYWTYTPHVEVREAAVYGVASLVPPGIRLHVEYDCRTKSNNLGFLQERDVQNGSTITAIVGDSFTSGHGGCPWFDRLQARRPQDALLNAGLPGTGFDHWSRLIPHIEREGLTISRLLILAINNDFKRKAWNWSDVQLKCVDQGLCPEEDSLGLYHPVGLADTTEELLASARERAAARFGTYSYLDRLGDWLKQNSYVHKFGRRAGATARAIFGTTISSEEAAMTEETIAALRQFKAMGVPLHILMIPQKDEAAIGSLGPDSQSAIMALEAENVSYSWCQLDRHDYMPVDGHPNRQGYDKIVDCVDSVLNDLHSKMGRVR